MDVYKLDGWIEGWRDAALCLRVCVPRALVQYALVDAERLIGHGSVIFLFT